MFMNRLVFFEKLYLEELESLEKEMRKHPLDMDYVAEWETLAELLSEIRKAKESLKETISE